MDYLNLIKQDLSNTFEGKNWYGPSTKQILDGIDAATAAKSFGPQDKSIWMITNHITDWMDEASNCLEGKELRHPKEWDWHPVDDRTEKAWCEAISRLAKSHQRFLLAVDGIKELNCEDEVVNSQGEAMGFTYEMMLQGIVQHNVYHMGQISLMKTL